MTAMAAVEVPWASAGAAGPSAKKATRCLSAASPTWCVTPSSLDTVLPRGRKMGSDRLERSPRLPALVTRLSEAWRLHGEQ